MFIEVRVTTYVVLGSLNTQRTETEEMHYGMAMASCLSGIPVR